MNISRLSLILLALALLSACSGGGGGSTTFPQPSWEKFRHDVNNRGAAVGAVAAKTPNVASVSVDVPPTTPGAISSSPAIAEDGTVYIASEAGTLAAFDAKLNPKWRLISCGACADDQSLGKLVSSPAIYTLSGQTNIFIGSDDGAVFGFLDTGNGQPTCTACFRPSFAATPGPTPLVHFVSSPSFTTDPVISTVNGVFIGAQIDDADGHAFGKLYALNANGSMNWEFPGRPSDGEIGPITSSPALGVGSTWYFTATDGNLYALAGDGTLRWKAAIGAVADPSLPFAPSPLTTANYILSPTGSGSIFAISPDGFITFRIPSGDSSFGASLAAGGPPLVSPTATLPPAPTPTPPAGPTATPSATPTVGVTTIVYGVTQSGQVVVFDLALPMPTVFPPQTPIPTPVISSPALSSDGFLVFGSSDGQLHIINTLTGGELTAPIGLAAGFAIRSSPSIAQDGTIYVGADDGKLYAVGLP